MGDKPVNGTRITVTLTGTVDYCSPGDLYMDLIGDDGRRHVIERPRPGDYVVERSMHVGEVWRTGTGSLYFVRHWNGISAAHDGKKVIPASKDGATYDTVEFLMSFPTAECVFSP